MADIATAFLSVLSGSFVGFSLGLIGGGGSVLATPVMLYVVGVPQPHVAIGTGAFAVSVCAYSGFLQHACARTVRWRPAILFALIGILGALGGSTLGKAVDGQHLLFFFGLGMIAIGVAMLRSRPKEQTSAIERQGFATDVRVAALAALTGLASGFFGIGGGILIVPALMLATRMEIINAVGSSLFAVGALGLTTAINYAHSGLVDWRLGLEFIFGGMLGAFFGMRLAVRLCKQKDMLRHIFAGLIFAVAAYVLYRSGRSIIG